MILRFTVYQKYILLTNKDFKYQKKQAPNNRQGDNNMASPLDTYFFIVMLGFFILCILSSLLNGKNSQIFQFFILFGTIQDPKIRRAFVFVMGILGVIAILDGLGLLKI